MKYFSGCAIAAVAVLPARAMDMGGRDPSKTPSDRDTDRQNFVDRMMAHYYQNADQTETPPTIRLNRDTFIPTVPVQEAAPQRRDDGLARLRQMSARRAAIQAAAARPQSSPDTNQSPSSNQNDSAATASVSSSSTTVPQTVNRDAPNNILSQMHNYLEQQAREHENQRRRLDAQLENQRRRWAAQLSTPIRIDGAIQPQLGNVNVADPYDFSELEQATPTPTSAPATEAFSLGQVNEQTDLSTLSRDNLQNVIRDHPDYTIRYRAIGEESRRKQDDNHQKHHEYRAELRRKADERNAAYRKRQDDYRRRQEEALRRLASFRTTPLTTPSTGLTFARPQSFTFSSGLNFGYGTVDAERRMREAEQRVQENEKRVQAQMEATEKRVQDQMAAAEKGLQESEQRLEEQMAAQDELADFYSQYIDNYDPSNPQASQHYLDAYNQKQREFNNRFYNSLTFF